MPEPGLTQTRSQRLARGAAQVLMWAQALLLLAAVPVLVLTVLFSLFEGGDAAAKHRLLVWAPVSVLGNLLCAVVLAAAAGAIRRRSDTRALRACACGLPAGLAVGWAWVCQGQLLTDPSMLGIWAGASLPAFLAVALVSLPAGPHPASTGPS